MADVSRDELHERIMRSLNAALFVGGIADRYRGQVAYGGEHVWNEALYRSISNAHSDIIEEIKQTGTCSPEGRKELEDAIAAYTQRFNRQWQQYADR